MARAAIPLFAAAIAPAGLVSLRLAGVASWVNNSPVQIPVIGLLFLIAFALGYQTGIAVGLAGLAVLFGALQYEGGGSFSVVAVMLTAGPWIVGQIVRSQRRLSEELAVRNEELASQVRAYTAEAVRYERFRIAADLHDTVGHVLSLMVVQASAGQRAAQAGGSSAREALAVVAEAAREAQTEVGLLAGLLSRAQEAGELGVIAGLVQRARGAGLDVTYRLTGEGDHRAGDMASASPASAEVASRIVTEALTNALRHAPGAPVTVEVRAAAGGLTVTVENGPSSQAGDDLAQAGGGYGLTGMRDRVLAQGGRFDAGPAGDGGWRVHATWPSR